MEWISVNDRLPEKEYPVLTTSVSSFGTLVVYSAMYNDGYYRNDGARWTNLESADSEELCAVTHWMPYPPPAPRPVEPGSWRKAGGILKGMFDEQAQAEVSDE